MALTSADTSVVFPVPAYPHSMNILRSSADRINSEIFSREFSCSAVGLKGKFDLICEAKYLFITFNGKKITIKKVYSFFYLIFVTRK